MFPHFDTRKPNKNLAQLTIHTIHYSIAAGLHKINKISNITKHLSGENNFVIHY